ncbi:phosphate signaling complex protein PhoU [Aequorivita antarctica]|uniref:Phosphate-specific transport system accessory protein PhoU n=1 Tax=Aequorivita antarctica TaxID=153266 RepID=A0A5C6Z4Z3_9FLAO|nr:phosphate signaling complex protein PhoU [Aequorivita antarctica]TXD74938.1 phosphate signaling complex protein PhoU [Aequorivita antarctica]SRX72337.1 Phosphate-specific transport system accessory protein PhoU [Aequorivita antarctica]
MVVNAEQQREVLNQYGLEMLALCQSQVEKAKDAFVNHDSDLAEEVINTEKRVNALDLKIEKDCEKFLALYTPVAIDLRFIMAIRKINFDLERIADHAEGISRYVVQENKPIEPSLLEALRFETMYETVTSMFENITTAYEHKDVKIARKVFKKDKILDKINRKSFKFIEAEIRQNIEITGQALILFSVIKKMERVGDLLKNVAEEIIFYIEADVVKHKKKK